MQLPWPINHMSSFIEKQMLLVTIPGRTIVVLRLRAPGKLKIQWFTWWLLSVSTFIYTSVHIHAQIRIHTHTPTPTLTHTHTHPHSPTPAHTLSAEASCFYLTLFLEKSPFSPYICLSLVNSFVWDLLFSSLFDPHTHLHTQSLTHHTYLQTKLTYTPHTHTHLYA